LAAENWEAEEERDELEMIAQDGLLSWEPGTLRVYKQPEALQLDLS